MRSGLPSSCNMLVALEGDKCRAAFEPLDGEIRPSSLQVTVCVCHREICICMHIYIYTYKRRICFVCIYTYAHIFISSNISVYTHIYAIILTFVFGFLVFRKTLSWICATWDLSARYVSCIHLYVYPYACVCTSVHITYMKYWKLTRCGIWLPGMTHVCSCMYACVYGCIHTW